MYVIIVDGWQGWFQAAVVVVAVILCYEAVKWAWRHGRSTSMSESDRIIRRAFEAELAKRGRGIRHRPAAKGE